MFPVLFPRTRIIYYNTALSVWERCEASHQLFGTGSQILPKKQKISLANLFIFRYNIKAISVTTCDFISICRCDGIGRRSGLKIHRWRQRTGSSPVTGTIKRLGSSECGALTILSGCSAVGSAPALGAGCRRFESCHSDHGECSYSI